MTVRFVLFLALAGLWMGPTLPASAQALTEPQAKAVVETMADYIAKMYVFRDKREVIAGALREGQKEGRFKSTIPQDLAAEITAALMAASNDKHLTVTYDPAQSRQLAAPGEPVDTAFFDAEGLRWNQGYVRQEILPGNIRYVRIRQFFWTDGVTQGVIDSAARFLSGGAAVIIDLRGNGGGHSDAVQRMISYLMPATPVELMTFIDGQTNAAEVTKSTGELPAPRITNKPVYVLIDRGAASAAEEFAYHIRQFKLGALVGETTAGAANNNVLLPLPHGFVASVSTGRPVHPISKTNWEGVGVPPDLKTASAAALDVAIVDALTALAKSSDAIVQRDAQWVLPVAAARVSQVQLSPDMLKEYIGRYGERTIALTGGVLTLQRDGRPAIPMTALGNDQFALQGLDDIRAKFVRRDGHVVELQVLYKDGRMTGAARDERR